MKTYGDWEVRYHAPLIGLTYLVAEREVYTTVFGFEHIGHQRFRLTGETKGEASRIAAALNGTPDFNQRLWATHREFPCLPEKFVFPTEVLVHELQRRGVDRYQEGFAAGEASLSRRKNTLGAVPVERRTADRRKPVPTPKKAPKKRR